MMGCVKRDVSNAKRSPSSCRCREEEEEGVTMAAGGGGEELGILDGGAAAGGKEGIGKRERRRHW